MADVMDNLVKPTMNIYAIDMFNFTTSVTEKSWDLFIGHLNDVQRSQIKNNLRFEVTGQITRNKYVIVADKPVQNIAYHVNVSIFYVYCIMTMPILPHCDMLLTQKLMIETDEARFLTIAHQYGYRLQQGDVFNTYKKYYSMNYTRG